MRVILFIACLIPAISFAGVEIYFLRHAEVDMSDPDKPLVSKGKARAEVLAEYFESKEITHIYVTNYHRTFDTAKPLSSRKGLKVIQIPKIGSKINGKEVTNRSKGNVAIKPVLQALNNLPDGSIAVVVANSGNLFPIMSKYGATQLPCGSKKCFPKKEFNNNWIVNSSANGVTLRTDKYGE